MQARTCSGFCLHTGCVLVAERGAVGRERPGQVGSGRRAHSGNQVRSTARGPPAWGPALAAHRRS